MTNCPDVLALQSYVDGELAADETGAVARHLEGCPECRRIVMSMQAVHSTLGATPPTSPPSRLFADIQAAIATDGHGLACDQAHEIISAALDDELSAEQSAALDLHLQECADCRYYAERMGLVTELLRGMEPVAPDPGLRGRVEAAVDKVAGYAGISRIFSAGFRRKLGAAAGLAAAAAIMLVVAFNLVHIAGPPQPSPTSPSEIIASTPAPAPQPELVSATPTEPEAAATRPPALPTAADMPPAAAPKPATRTHWPSRVTSAPTPRGEPAASGPQPALQEPAAQPAKAVTIMPLVGAKPVTIARRTETPPAATAPPSARTAAGDALIGTPIKLVVISEPETTPPPAPARATLAKARPSTPTSLKASEPAGDSGAMRLASASWVPVSEAPRTVFRSPATSPARLASATERISRETATSGAPRTRPLASW